MAHIFDLAPFLAERMAFRKEFSMAVYFRFSGTVRVSILPPILGDVREGFASRCDFPVLGCREVDSKPHLGVLFAKDCVAIRFPRLGMMGSGLKVPILGGAVCEGLRCNAILYRKGFAFCPQKGYPCKHYISFNI